MTNFIESFNEQQVAIYKTAVSKGWWDSGRCDAECIALMHSELSECLEALRKGNPKDDKLPEFTNAEIELADCIIRIMDFAGSKKLRIAEAIIAKAEFNKTRPVKHGKEF